MFLSFSWFFLCFCLYLFFFSVFLHSLYFLYGVKLYFFLIFRSIYIFILIITKMDKKNFNPCTTKITEFLKKITNQTIIFSTRETVPVCAMSSCILSQALSRYTHANTHRWAPVWMWCMLETLYAEIFIEHSQTNPYRQVYFY